MQPKLKKTLLANLVLFSLTACGSGGGGGSSEPSTANSTSGTITVPNVNPSNGSSTAQTTPSTTTPNTTVTTPAITASTFKVGNDGYATGKATYASADSSIVLNTDFDKRVISGSAKGQIDGESVNITLHDTTLYKSTKRYLPSGNYISYEKSYDFLGSASAITSNQEKFIGEYGGAIWGNSSDLDSAKVGYYVTSEKDPNRTIKENGEKGMKVDTYYTSQRTYRGYYNVGTSLGRQ